MIEHPTAEQLRRYAIGDANPEEILDLDDHLSTCGECRSRLSPSSALAEWADGLAADDDDRHLTHEQLVARVEHRVEDADLFAIEAHLKSCRSCREEVADLARFRNELQPNTKRRGWVIPAAAASAAAVVLGISLLRKPVPPVAHFEAPASWSQQDRALVGQALATGDLPFAPIPQELTAKPGTLLGPSVQAEFGPLSPTGRIVFSDRPQFRWSALAGAKSYRVEVYTADFRQAARSGAIESTEWTPGEPLARGVLYRWQIVATKGAQTITAPAPPAPEARFQIVDQSTADAVEHARSGNDGRLLAAVLLARAGLHDYAVAELRAISPELRKFPEVENLLNRAH